MVVNSNRNSNRDNKSPVISVIMAVYNAEDYLADAIDSILNQTFTDFELVIVNDGSTDGSKKILESYKDRRVSVINQKNKGPVAARNTAIQHSRGAFIAVMDSDDISLPTRLQKEVSMMQANPSLGAVGSNYIGFNEQGVQWTTNVFTHPDDLKACMVLCNQFGHASVMFRRSVLDQVGLYSSESGGMVEDYDLLIRVSHVAELANIPEPLLMWRKRAESITHSKLNKQIEDTFTIRDREFQRLLHNRRDYKLFGYHHSGNKYLARKSTLYRDYAYLYRKNNHLGTALTMMLAATLCQPFNKRNYKRTILLLHRRWFNRYWDYEFL